MRHDHNDPSPPGPSNTYEGDTACPVCDGTPRVLVAIRHPAMRGLTQELLQRECQCWVATEVDCDEVLHRAVGRLRPDLVVVDVGDFPACARHGLGGFPPARVIVIGPEPDASYRRSALASGAGAWISRDRVGDDLGPEMRRVLGCIHDPCPPGDIGLVATAAGSQVTKETP